MTRKEKQKEILLFLIAHRGSCEGMPSNGSGLAECQMCCPLYKYPCFPDAEAFRLAVKVFKRRYGKEELFTALV